MSERPKAKGEKFESEYRKLFFINASVFGAIGGCLPPSHFHLCPRFQTPTSGHLLGPGTKPHEAKMPPLHPFHSANQASLSPSTLSLSATATLGHKQVSWSGPTKAISFITDPYGYPSFASDDLL